ncbi:hypothetical protein BROUX41_001041 [Berkeleyomyces rouxiae]|uniref:uncharacterized protein n=1 Tax=Berkeleyomyces rouxiae TaxID=2035830 RepID=UPI003B791C79
MAPKRRQRASDRSTDTTATTTASPAVASARDTRRTSRNRPSQAILEPDSPVQEGQHLAKPRSKPRKQIAPDQIATASSSRAGPRPSRLRRSHQPGHAEDGSTESAVDEGAVREALDDEVNDPEFTEPALPKSKRGRMANSYDTSQISTAPVSKRPRLSQTQPRDASERQSASILNPGTQAHIDPVARKYLHLAPRVRQIPRSVIEEKWSPLEPSSQAAVKALLHLAAQPALSRTGTNPARHKAGLAVVQAVSKRIQSKLGRGLPFPPASANGVPVRGGPSVPRRRKDGDAGRTDELDFEKILAGVGVLEDSLDTLMHSVALLEKERDRLVQDIEREHVQAVKLEGDVKKEATMWRESLRKAHVLVPGARRPEQLSSSIGDRRTGCLFTVHDAKDLPGEAFRGLDAAEGETADEVHNLARQVASHMESIRGNMAQIDGVVPQIGRTRAALQSVLAKNLDPKLMQTVILG